MGSSSSSDGAWRSSAFGLALEGDFPAPGLPVGAPGPRRAPTRLALRERAELDADWPAAEAERLAVEHLGRAQPQRTIDHHPEAGYRLYASRFGLARISNDGREVRCAPPGVAPWNWQRFLVGRVLPFTAAIRGLEPVHAGAVSVDGATVGLIGASGAGKTSVVLRLVLGGARFVSDDVLALEATRGDLIAHPGAAVASVRIAEDRLLGPDRRRVGRVLGRSDKVYLEVEREHRPRPLRGLYFLQRPAAARGIEIDAIDPDPALLLGSTFVIEVRTRARLVAQMDVASRLARDVPLFRAVAGEDVGATAFADGIAAHVRERLA